MSFLRRNPELAAIKAAAEDQKDFTREQTVMENSTLDDQVMLQHQQERSDLIRWQQDLGDDMFDLRMRLKSQEKFGDKWESVKMLTPEGKTVNAPPLVNDLGVQIIMQCIAPLMSRNLIQSDFKEDRILLMLRNTMWTIIDNFTDNYQKYDAEFENLDHIMRLIMNTIISAPYRAKDGAERKIGSAMNKRVESYHHAPPREEKRKLFGFM